MGTGTGNRCLFRTPRSSQEPLRVTLLLLSPAPLASHRLPSLSSTLPSNWTPPLAATGTWNRCLVRTQRSSREPLRVTLLLLSPASLSPHRLPSLSSTLPSNWTPPLAATGTGNRCLFRTLESSQDQLRVTRLLLSPAPLAPHLHPSLSSTLPSNWTPPLVATRTRNRCLFRTPRSSQERLRVSWVPQRVQKRPEEAVATNHPPTAKERHGVSDDEAKCRTTKQSSLREGNPSLLPVGCAARHLKIRGREDPKSPTKSTPASGSERYDRNEVLKLTRDRGSSLLLRIR